MTKDNDIVADNNSRTYNDWSIEMHYMVYNKFGRLVYSGPDPSGFGLDYSINYWCIESGQWEPIIGITEAQCIADGLECAD